MSKEFYPIIKTVQIDGYKKRAELLEQLAATQSFSDFRKTYIKHMMERLGKTGHTHGRYMESLELQNIILNNENPLSAIAKTLSDSILASTKIHIPGKSWIQYAFSEQQEKKFQEQIHAILANESKNKTHPYDILRKVIDAFSEFKKDLNANPLEKNGSVGIVKNDGAQFKEALNKGLFSLSFLQACQKNEKEALIEKKPSQIFSKIMGNAWRPGRESKFNELWKMESIFEGNVSPQGRVQIEKNENAESNQEWRKDLRNMDPMEILLISPWMGKLYTTMPENKSTEFKIFDRTYRQNLAEDTYLFSATADNFDRDGFLNMLKNGSFTQQQIKHGRNRPWERVGFTTKNQEPMEEEFRLTIKEECKQFFYLMVRDGWGSLENGNIHNRGGLIGKTQKEIHEFFTKLVMDDPSFLAEIHRFIDDWEQLADNIKPNLSNFIAFVKDMYGNEPPELLAKRFETFFIERNEVRVSNELDLDDFQL